MSGHARRPAPGQRTSSRAVDYERLRSVLVGSARPLIEMVVASSLQFADYETLLHVAESSLDFVSSVPEGELPDALPAPLRQQLSSMAHQEPEEWDVPADVRRSVIHEAFVFTGQFLSERAFAAGIDKAALQHWIAIMQRFEDLLQTYMAAIAHDVRAAKTERARLLEARQLATVLRDSVVAQAARTSLHVADQRTDETGMIALPDWATHPSPMVAAVVVRNTSDDCAANLALLPSVGELPRPSLAALHYPESVLLVPAEALDEVEPALVEFFAPDVVVVGLTVPLTRAEQSLAWCRRALALQVFGRSGSNVDSTTVVRCADMVTELLISADASLLQWAADTLFAPFAGMTGYRRTILLETLAAWCRRPHVGIPAIARELDKHPQTVRYRLGQLRLLLGDALEDDRQLLLMRLAFALHLD